MNPESHAPKSLLTLRRGIALLVCACIPLTTQATGLEGLEEPASHWECVNPQAGFSPRDTAEGVVFDGKMWLSNGYYPGNILSRDLWVSGDGVEWSQVSSETPYDGYSEMTVFQDKMWAIKGSVWNSVNGTDWDQVLEQTPFGVRGYGEVVVFQGRMWQLGSGSDVWNSVDGIHWTPVVSQAPFGDRTAAAVLVHDRKLWLMGGYLKVQNDPPEQGYPQFTTLCDVWCSSDGSEWQRVAEKAPWSPRMWAGAIVIDDKMWIIGGYDNRHQRNLGDVWTSENGVDWKEVPTHGGFSPRHEPTCYDFANRLWVVDGNSWPVLNDVWRFRP